MINLPVQYSKEYNDHMLVDPVELHINDYLHSEFVFIKQKKKTFFFITSKGQQKEMFSF